ncbi:MAG: hypothetical protein OXU36_04360, partial [Candidatus Poribacteria bacterium]|nr:hypothetical protein [Candidatus Poribacteria bacterium]
DNPATIAGTAPAAPAPTYLFKGSTIVVSWPAVQGADFYRVYYDDFFSSSCRVRGTRASFCELLADNITATTYTHTSPDDETNYYWVTACNGSGCSPLDSDNPATIAGTAPAAPAPTYVFAGSTIVVSWPAVQGADFYRVYYDDFFSSSCRVRGTRASFCELLADNITATTYTHTSPDDETNYYWVTACNGSGCSPVDSNNPATTTTPTTPTTTTTTPTTTTTTVPPTVSGDCYVGLTLRPGDRCTYPGRTEEFWVDESGRGRFLFFTTGTRISTSGRINGVLYNFAASKQSDGSWLIEAAG